MAIFHISQVKHEPFWQYLSRLNDYHSQCVHFKYKKWKICNVVHEGITHKSQAILEFMLFWWYV